MPTSRRKFLLVLLGSGAYSLIYPNRAVSSWEQSRTTDALRTTLADFFDHKESARVVGLEYLCDTPAEWDVELLVDRIFFDRIRCRTEFGKAGTNTRREVLLKQIHDDFEKGRVVKVRGWVLSQTEARLCALAGLFAR